MGLFSKNNQKNGEIVSPEGLVNYWIFYTTNIVNIVEKNAKKAGYNVFGRPITEEGVFGLNSNHVLEFLLNTVHANNLLSANVSYSLSKNEASSIIVRLGPLWVESIYHTYVKKLYKLPPDVDAGEVVLMAYVALRHILKCIDELAEIPENNLAEIEEATSHYLSLMRDDI